MDVKDTRIRFTWGGGETYALYLCTGSGRYDVIAWDIKSCHDAQRMAQRGNLALQRYQPELLHPDAELPGVGFQYSSPKVSI